MDIKYPIGQYLNPLKPSPMKNNYKNIPLDELPIGSVVKITKLNENCPWHPLTKYIVDKEYTVKYATTNTFIKAVWANYKISDHVSKYLFGDKFFILYLPEYVLLTENHFTDESK